MKNDNSPETRNKSGFHTPPCRRNFFHSVAAIAVTLCFFAACGPSDPDYLEKLYGEIAWANAERLTVNVEFPANWGFSQQSGTDRCADLVNTKETPRMGYAFNVEFSPMPEFGFEKWLAFPTSEYIKLDIRKSYNETQFDPDTLEQILPQRERERCGYCGKHKQYGFKGRSRYNQHFRTGHACALVQLQAGCKPDHPAAGE